MIKLRLIQTPDLSAGAPLTNRGYLILYHQDEVNHCPGCGRTHWYVGRTSAECGFCSTALPLAGATQ